MKARRAAEPGVAVPEHRLRLLPVARRCAVTAGCALSICWGLVASGCRESGEPAAETAREKPAESLEPFRFALPSGFEPLELRGVGSESLSAPPGATVSLESGAFSIGAGPSFALVVRQQELSLGQLASSMAPESIVLSDRDVLVFGKPNRYRFVAVRELVPEWDESDRRWFTCSSPGALDSGAETPTFDHASIEAMVAACRSLDLPKLE